MIWFLSLLILVEGSTSDDSVTDLPGWGDRYTGNMYSGYVDINSDCHSKMFYWMLEKEGGSVEGETPVLLWLNGGPGASSMDGLFMEKIGPYQIYSKGWLYNKHRWTDKYNVLIIDNPVGTGYSYTDNRPECYASNEYEVAADFYIALNEFFNEKHTEYSKNPFFLTGESYAGKYIPNIATYLLHKEFPFVGVILGNGLYEPEVQYLTVPDYAWNLGILDERHYANMRLLATNCTFLIRYGDPVVASTYCEDFVDAIYSDIGGGVWEYDVREFYDTTASKTDDMGTYLGRADVQAALHTTGATWTDADETGPVADALRADFITTVIPQLKQLLNAGKFVVLYNGQMDGTVCNHVGNSLILNDITWTGQPQFANSKQSLWRVDDKAAIGYRRSYENLVFVMIANAGHLVPMTQPENYRKFLDTVVEEGLLRTGKYTRENKPEL